MNLERHIISENATNSLEVFSGDVGFYFGCWKFTDDFEVQKKLFLKAEEWIQMRGGREYFGPLDQTTLNNYRLRISHFDKLAFFGEPGNGISQVRFLEKMGFKIDEKYFTYEVTDLQKVRDFIAGLEKQMVQMPREKLEFELFSLASWPENAKKIYELSLEIFAQNYAFSKYSFEEFTKVYNDQVLQLLCQETSLLAKMQGEIVGFGFNFKDPLCKERLLIKTLGIKKEYRALGTAFIDMLNFMLSQKTTYQECLLCLMKENNAPALWMKDLIQDVREYALFKKTF